MRSRHTPIPSGVPTLTGYTEPPPQAVLFPYRGGASPAPPRPDIEA